MGIFSRIGLALFGSKRAKRESAIERLQRIADSTGRSEYNFRESVVDLMKLLNMDSSITARKALAGEMGYRGKLDGSAEMNLWLHKRLLDRA